MPLFKPDYYVKSFQYLDINRLRARGIRLLLCDIDNTLVAFDDPDSNQAVRRFLQAVRSRGIEVALMSNNFKSRTSHFARDLGVENVYSFSMKPLPVTFWRAMKDHGCQPHEVALIGDQLFTDILGGNLSGIYTILSAPIVERERLDTWMMRILERVVFRWYEKKNIMKRGDFDD